MLSVYWIVLLVLLISCGDDMAPTPETLGGEETGEGRCGVDVLVLVDSSGSMADSDPENLRLEAAKRIVERIADDTTLSEGTRIGVVSFSDDAQVISPLDRASSVRDAISDLSVPVSGNTNLLAALYRGYQTFAAAGTFPHRKPVLLFLTDGSPYDVRKLKETGAYFLELQAFIKEKLKPRGCAIYVVGVDVRGQWGQMEGYWREIADGVYGVEGVEGLEPALRNIIEQIYGIPPAVREIVKPGADVVFTIPSYTEELQIYVLNQGSGGHLALYRPDGSVVIEGEGGVLIEEYGSYKRLSLLEPAHGDWMFRAREGEFAVYRKLVPYRLKLLKPEGIHPLGKPLRLEIAFLKNDGRPVAELSGYRLRFLGRIIAPSGMEHELEFEAGAAGRYCAKSALIPEVEGRYKVTLTVQGGDAFRSETAETVTVELMPYIVITKPVNSTLYFGDLEVEASLFQAGEPLPVQELGDASVLARLRDPAGKVLTTWLELKPDSPVAKLCGSFLEALKEEGQYQLEVKALGSDASAETLSFRARRGLIDRLSRRAAYAGMGLTGLLVFGVLAFLIRARKFPRIVGCVSAHLSSDEDVFLGQKRIYRKRWSFLHLKRHKDTSGRWLLVAGASAGENQAVNIWCRAGLTLAKRRLYRDSVLGLGKHTLKYD